MSPGPVGTAAVPADTDADLVVVGAGPAGAATAIGALGVGPGLRVLLLDRADFPRDKACGDGVAPHVLDLLAEAGVPGLLDDRTPVDRLALRLGDARAERTMARPAWVVPRRVLDARLVDAAVAAGAELRRHRVREVHVTDDHVAVSGTRRAGAVRGRLVVGADGAHSVVRRHVVEPRSAAERRRPVALALRGYAPVPPSLRGTQTIVFGTTRQPSYAWAFDRGDGLANVGYGELLTDRHPAPTRRQLLGQLEVLLPGASDGGHDWRAHHLPLSTGRPLRPARGRVLLVGDAAGLVNPLTGEGIFYAVATGLAAGRAAAHALLAGRDADAGTAYSRAARRLLGRHLRHTALAARLSHADPVLRAGVAAAGADQDVFDDLVELGLACGTLTPRLATGLARSLVRTTPTRTTPTRTDPTRPTRRTEETTACES